MDDIVHNDKPTSKALEDSGVISMRLIIPKTGVNAFLRIVCFLWRIQDWSIV